MKIVIDPLFLRRPKLNYISPAVCEAIFSGTGSPIIVLDDISKLPGPTGLVWGGRGQFRLSWNRYPGALCYNVYTAILTETQLSFPCTDLQETVQGDITFAILEECLINPFVVVSQPGCYRISAITGDGESDLSDPICTCECPDCVCPPGTEFYPDYNDCLCSPQACPGGQTWDPILCQCVPCGTQQCPPSFIPDYPDPCNCIPSPGGSVNVCNEEQTATCPGDSVTIPAGTFCMQAPNRLPATIAAAQAQMNADALAQAESELECDGWRICNWVESVRAAISTGLASAGCTGSVAPEWDGVFDKSYSFVVGPINEVKYFDNQSILGNAVAPSEFPGYPGGNWQDMCFTRLYYNAASGTWTLSIGCAFDCTGNQYAWVGEMVNNEANNPGGIYTQTSGFSSGPATIEVVPTSGGHCTGCQAVPQSIQNTVFTQGPFGAFPACGSFAITNGSGTWSLTQNLSTCTENFIEITGQTCNPNEDPYTLTVNIPWDDSGNVAAGVHTVQFQLNFNGSLVDSVTRDLATGPFTPVILSAPLSPGITTIRIGVVFQCVPSPSVTANNLGPLTITPLTPP